MITFDIAFDRLISAEGGYVNDPQDPGGETNWGISKRAYPDLDIKLLTRAQAKEIYMRDFWNRIHADEVPGSVAFQTLDFAVHSGIQTAIRYLQRAANTADDGYWGPASRSAVAATTETDLVMRLNALRLKYMTKLKGWSHDGKGWADRIADNLLYGASDT